MTTLLLIRFCWPADILCQFIERVKAVRVIKHAKPTRTRRTEAWARSSRPARLKAEPQSVVLVLLQLLKLALRLLKVEELIDGLFHVFRVPGDRRQMISVL